MLSAAPLERQKQPTRVHPRKVSTAPLVSRLFATTSCPKTAEDSREKRAVPTNAGASGTRKPQPYVAPPSYARLNAPHRQNQRRVTPAPLIHIGGEHNQLKGATQNATQKSKIVSSQRISIAAIQMDK
jgi:hypothetical protein